VIFFHWIALYPGRDVACYVSTKCIELEMINSTMNIWNSSNLIVLKTLITRINSPNRNLITLFSVQIPKFNCNKSESKHGKNSKMGRWFFYQTALYPGRDVACYVSTKYLNLIAMKRIPNAEKIQKCYGYFFHWIALYSGRDVACYVSCKYPNLIVMNRNSKHGKNSKMVWWFFSLKCVVSG